MSDATSPRQWLTDNVRWVVVTLLVPLAGLVWDEVNARQAERAANEAAIDAKRAAGIENLRRDSQLIVQLLPALGEKDPDSAMRPIALAMLGNMANRGALSPDMIQAVTLAIERTEARVRAGDASSSEKQALRSLAEQTDTPTLPDVTTPTPVPRAVAVRVNVPRVYIHVFDEAQRDSARSLANWCEEQQRWLAPGIENVATTAARQGKPVRGGTRTGDVRFFNAEDRPRAEQIAKHLRAQGLPSIQVVAARQRAPAGQLEVWFPNDNAAQG